MALSGLECGPYVSPKLWVEILLEAVQMTVLSASLYFWLSFDVLHVCTCVYMYVYIYAPTCTCTYCVHVKMSVLIHTHCICSLVLRPSPVRMYTFDL